MTTALRLTELAHGGGCGCKLAPAVLQQLLAGSPAAAAFPQLLVGTETIDDAAVWQLPDGSCAIATTDFFMPVVDDAHDFGRIAATNAISDIYAMGGTPLFALAILGIPLGKLPIEIDARHPCRRRGGVPRRRHSCRRRPLDRHRGADLRSCRHRQLSAGATAPQLRRAPRRRADPDQGDRCRHLRQCPAQGSARPRRLRRNARQHDATQQRRRDSSAGRTRCTPSPT